MVKKISKFLLVASFLTILVLPAKTYAVSWFPIVPCGIHKPVDNKGNLLPKPWPLANSYYEDCNQCTLIQLGKNVIDMTFYAIVPSVGTLLFMIAGFIILFNARSGNPDGVTRGRKIMSTTAVGIAIILGSWLITNFILKSLAPNQAAGVCLSNGFCDTNTSKSCKADSDCPGTPWYQIQCRVGSLKDLTDNTLPSIGGGGSTGGGTNGGGTGTGGTGTGGTGTTGGSQCLQSGLNLCQGNAPQGCANSSCGQYSNAISQAISELQNNGILGVVTPNILKAFMEVESSCNINPPGNGPSFGLMQLTPPIPQIYAQYCSVSVGTINANPRAWLTNPANAEKILCIAGQWINAVAQSQCGSDVRNLYAGYNGGTGPNGACGPSVSCAADTSCAGGPVKRWECLYENTAHTQCNGGTDINSGYNQTRQGATRAISCAANPGF